MRLGADGPGDAAAAGGEIADLVNGLVGPELGWVGCCCCWAACR